MSVKECQFISLQQLKSKLFSPDDFVLLDVREISEFREGHIEGSKLIPLGILPHRLDELDRDKEIVVVCRSGNRSKQACDILKEHGFQQVYSLTGGLSGWVA
ncbi:rhodanese-like domain-containing protein [Ferviditalea candida]|uniref:Rhodanese-like domain-containing protein n=1 Tax=Ferviditalea candida TaxID=3108399 RepID=A0ABU5ZE19_9BACL|nr:rhodanese-like domain-containing protein [Paenibacillaceae bacterium T2]